MLMRRRMADVSSKASAKPAPKKDSAKEPVRQAVKPDTSALMKAQLALEELPEAVEGMLRPWRYLLMNYAKGIAYALGVMTAFAIVIPFIVWFLRALPWGPIMDDLIEQVLERVEQAETR